MEEHAITIKSKLKKPLGFFVLCCFFVIKAEIVSHFNSAHAAETSGIGPVLDRFNLTLETGYRTEAVGPFFYSETKDSENTWAIPPFFSCNRDPATDAQEENIFYPLLTHIRYGKEQRWQFFQLLSFSSGQEQEVDEKKRFTIFPFYFQQRSPDTNLNYTAYFPIYGHLKDRLFRDEIFFVMFPIYGETRKRDVVTENYLYPFGHIRHGDGLSGWQVWPVVGREHKDVTTSTNGFGDVSVVAGHDKSFFLWPLWLKQDTGIGTENPEKFRASIPFYASTRSPQRDSTSVLWPFFTWIDDRGKKYHEWQGPWPFVIFTRGEGKTTSRVFPLFSESRNAVKESDSYLWPVYVYHRAHADPLDQKKTRVLFYLYSKTTEKNTQTGAEKRRLDMWPLFTWHRDFNGNERLQVLAPLEPVLPNNRGIERNWSPLWSLWRAEDNAKTGAASRSLLWNLYRRDTAPAHKKVSLLFGLFQYQSDGEARQTRLFYFTVSKTSPAAK
jgi:hypothetical protein